MAGHLSRSDLAAGAIAAALLTVAAAFHLNLWLAITLAVVTYTGIAWLWPRHDEGVPGKPQVKRFAIERALANTVAIHLLLPQIERPETREHVERINRRIAQVMKVIAEDKNLAAATIFNEHVLVPVRALLTEYVRLSDRDIGGARELLEKTESHDLPLIEQAIESFYERLHRSHMADLATLGDLLEINLESLATTPARRFTS